MNRIDIIRIFVALIMILTIGTRGIVYARSRSIKNVAILPLPYTTWIIFIVWYSLMIIFIMWPSLLYNSELLSTSMDVVLERVGIGMLIIAEALFLSSMYYLADFYSIDLVIKEGHSIIKKGPYRFIRHPMYTSYIISYVGFGIMLRNIFILLFLPIFIFVFWKTACIEEKAFEDYLRIEFSEYKQKVGMFIPKLNKW